MSRSEVERIADQLERSYRGEAWHGPCLVEVLEGVDEARASRRAVAGAHTIAELVRHVVAWQDEAVRRIDGRGRKLPPEDDWPDGEDWSDVVSRLESSTKALAARIRELDPETLDDPVPGQRHSLYALLHGVVQHNLYHAGQIAILKKA